MKKVEDRWSVEHTLNSPDVNGTWIKGRPQNTGSPCGVTLPSKGVNFLLGGQREPLARRGERLEMLLNILQHTGQFPSPNKALPRLKCQKR